MKKFLLLLAGAATASLLNARTVTYDVGIFDQLTQFGNIDIVYTANPDSLGLATYESETDYSDAIEITNNKGKLLIKEVNGHELGKVPTIRVYSGSLSQIKSEGDGEITATLSSATPTLSLSLVGNGLIICRGVNVTDLSASITTGNGHIVIDGRCDEANYKLTGTGTIQADGLTAEKVKCTVLGTGTIGCSPEKLLDVRGIGTTKVYYNGQPEIKKVGGAKLIPLQKTSVFDASEPTADSATRQPVTTDEDYEEAEEPDGEED